MNSDPREGNSAALVLATVAFGACFLLGASWVRWARICRTTSLFPTRDQAQIEVLLSEAGPEATTIVVNGRIWGLGPWATSHLNGEMNRLRNAAEVAAHRSPDRQ